MSIKSNKTKNQDINEQKINEQELKNQNQSTDKCEEDTQEPEVAANDDQESQTETNSEAAEISEEEEVVDPLEVLQKAFAELEKAKEDVDNQMLRLQADFDNYRKRTRAEKEEWRSMIVSGFCGDILPVLDNFRWAVMAMEKDEAAKTHLAGIRMILKQLTDVLHAKGVEQIKTLGEDFDPKFHDAIGRVEVEEEAQDNKIIEEITAGYKIGDKVIRAARVKVGMLKTEDKSNETPEQ